MRPQPPVFVVVSGPPASGKTTLGPPLAAALGLSYFAKDDIKQRLIAEVGAADVEASRRLGSDAMSELLRIAAMSDGGVLDGTWLRSRAALVRSLPGTVVEVFCRCDQLLIESRFRRRSEHRGTGHFDADRSWDELWGPETSEPMAGGWPVLEVNTAQPVDVADLARRIRSVIASE